MIAADITIMMIHQAFLDKGLRVAGGDGAFGGPISCDEPSRWGPPGAGCASSCAEVLADLTGSADADAAVLPLENKPENVPYWPSLNALSASISGHAGLASPYK
jgi:hypothetical protein